MLPYIKDTKRTIQKQLAASWAYYHYYILITDLIPNVFVDNWHMTFGRWNITK